MLMQTMLKRLAVLLAFVPLIFIVQAGLKQREIDREYDKSQLELALYFDDAYERIPGMDSYQVESLLRSPGRAISPPKWPSKIGELPLFEDGIPFEIPIHSDDRIFRVVVPPDKKSWWRDKKILWLLWNVPGKHRWIAVAFFNDDSGGSLTVPKAITTKSGLDEEFPDRLF